MVGWKRITLLFLSFFTISNFLLGQKESNNWFFGNLAAISFNNGAPSVISTGALSNFEGCAAVSDASGNLLLYSDGTNVYNKNNTIIPKTKPLGGCPSSTQAAALFLKPGSTTMYCVFAIGDYNTPGLRYSEIDITLNAGTGGFTAIMGNIISSTAYEKLTTVKHSNGKDVWVIAYDPSGFNFKSYLVTAAGLNLTPVLSPVTIAPSGTNAIGYLKASPSGKKIAAAWCYAANQFELYDFDKSTGKLSNLIVLPKHTPVSVDYGAYGVEFSPDETKLYCTNCAPADIYQYEICSNNQATINASKVKIGTSTSNFNGALQMGPNGKIYLSRCYTSFLGVINKPNVKGSACNYVDNGIDLSPKTVNLGLPNITPHIFKNTGFKHDTVLSNCLTAVFDTIAIGCGTTTCNGTTWSWNFGEPSSGINNTSTLYNPQHHYANAGTYTVTLVSSSNCGTDSSQISITVKSCGFSVTSVGGAVCEGQCKTLTPSISSGTPPYTYQWLPMADTTKTVNACPSTKTTYTIQITDAKGITATNTVTVDVNSINASISSTNASCLLQNDGSAQLENINGGTSPYSYSWTGLSANTPSVSNLQTGTYTATITDFNNCTYSLSTTIATINGPTANAGNSVTIVPGSNTQLNASGGDSYSWSPSTTLSCSTCVNPIATPLENTWYVVTVTDTNGCTSRDSLLVSIETPCDEIFIPTAFSPNNDAVNDIFKVRGSKHCIKDFTLEVYNRWGEKVFESFDIDTGWDGTYKNKQEDAAVFIFMLRATIISTGESFEKRGNITLTK